VEPTPAADATPISPPCSSTSSRLMNRPRPDPPYSMYVFGEACEKRWNSLLFSAGVRPQPVSWTAKWMYRRAPSRHSGALRKSSRRTLVGTYCMDRLFSIGLSFVALMLIIMFRVGWFCVNLMALV